MKEGMKELGSLVPQVEAIVRQAGVKVVSHFRKPMRWQQKKRGLVTQADLESEQFLIERLTPLIEGAGFIAEESQAKAGNDYCWVIDPLDGTNNFVHGIPYFAISVGLTYRNNPVLGVIYAPCADELYWAVEGLGAWRNGTRLTLDAHALDDKTMVMIGLLHHKTFALKKAWQDTPLAPLRLGLRHFGAAAIDMAYVASGWLDAFWSDSLGWWDVAAAICLVKESGGLVTDFTDKPINGDISCLAGHPALYTPLAKVLKV